MKKFLFYFNKYIGLITFVLIFLLFCYFRLKPIFLQTVPYTFDQGRDFIKAQGIIRDLKPVLSGPTTGIPGLNHGVWWYYFLAIPYLIFSGLPAGYPLFVFIISLSQLILFSYFLKKEFGLFPSLMFTLLVAGSPYFIMMSFFVINGVFGFPFILLFLYSVYKLFKTEQLGYFFWIFLSIGFIFESELPNGALTSIAFLIILFLFKKIGLFFSKKGIKNSLLGIFFPLTPRILYEIFKGFPQSRILFNFAFHPEFHTPKPYDAIFRDRISLFKDYFSRILPNDQPGILIYLFFLIAIIGIIITIIKNKKSFRFLLFSPLMLILFFILSCLYKDFFWDNYYEGIRYYFIITLTLGINGFLFIKNKAVKLISWLLFSLLLFINIVVLLKEVKNNQVPNEGLRKQIAIINKMYELNQGKKDFCVRIYTPPVIPYTYDYLFDYYHDFQHKVRPTTEYVNYHCWYIFESEMNEHFEFRIKQYRKDNIPMSGKLVKVIPVYNDVTFELWEYYPNKQK
jgi:hypothetical protein